MTDDDLTEEELQKLTEMRKEESHGSQLETEANQPDFVDAIADALTRVEDGKLSGSVSFYDPRGALIAALQADDRDDVARALAEAAGNEYEDDWIEVRCSVEHFGRHSKTMHRRSLRTRRRRRPV